MRSLWSSFVFLCCTALLWKAAYAVKCPIPLFPQGTGSNWFIWSLDPSDQVNSGFRLYFGSNPTATTDFNGIDVTTRLAYPLPEIYTPGTTLYWGSWATALTCNISSFTSSSAAPLVGSYSADFDEGIPRRFAVKYPVSTAEWKTVESSNGILRGLLTFLLCDFLLSDRSHRWWSFLGSIWINSCNRSFFACNHFVRFGSRLDFLGLEY